MRNSGRSNTASVWIERIVLHEENRSYESRELVVADDGDIFAVVNLVLAESLGCYVGR